MLLHLAVTQDWEARSEQAYRPAGLATEGFVHCCTPGQLLGVVERYYQHRQDLVLLRVDPAGLDCDVIWENTTAGAELFPHLYGPIPLPAIVSASSYLPSG